MDLRYLWAYPDDLSHMNSDDVRLFSHIINSKHDVGSLEIVKRTLCFRTEVWKQVGELAYYLEQAGFLSKKDIEKFDTMEHVYIDRSEKGMQIADSISQLKLGKYIGGCNENVIKNRRETPTSFFRPEKWLITCLERSTLFFTYDVHDLHTFLTDYDSIITA